MDTEAQDYYTDCIRADFGFAAFTADQVHFNGSGLSEAETEGVLGELVSSGRLTSGDGFYWLTSGPRGVVR